jgi:transcriptional antiterminator RfaH
MDSWYVAHTHPRGEHLALTNLRRQKFEAYLPQYLKRRRHARRTDWVMTPLFPRYLFVNMDVAQTRWRAINSTIGVHYLVCNGDLPTPIPPGIVEEIRAREDDKGVVLMDRGPLFKKGEVVQITTGALSDQVGLFDCATDDQRVVILLELLGRHVRVHVSAEAVRPFA